MRFDAQTAPIADLLGTQKGARCALHCPLDVAPPRAAVVAAVPMGAAMKPPKTLSSFAYAPFEASMARSGDFLQVPASLSHVEAAPSRRGSSFREMEHPPPPPPPPKGLSWDEKKLCSQQEYYEDCIQCCREKMPAHSAKCMHKFCTPLLTKPKPQDLQ
ncbi:unnamed protein product [Durusdinium trenchii]|uniref:Uncharacterized protein n=1 Tax=Durusdinium trenchii TaxID=1381693 RepID=A0ABP0JGY7_9DINO